jgi:long-subunit fatty acid transport protein
MRVGLSYRSSMKYTLEGTLNGATPVRADVELPDTAILSVWQQVSDRWEAMGDLSYTRWNSLKSWLSSAGPAATSFRRPVKTSITTTPGVLPGARPTR